MSRTHQLSAKARLTIATRRMELMERIPSSSLRVRQARDRMGIASRMLSESAHPSRVAHVPAERRAQVLRHYERAQLHVRAAEILLRDAA